MAEDSERIYKMGFKIQLLKSSIAIIEELIADGKWMEALEMTEEIKVMGE